MNLLNVRFYLYERVIVHPTKCAAGSMLGTSLQLLGWRRTASGDRPSLPQHLRFVGDDVFLHDISAALDFVVDTICDLSGDTQIEDQHVHQIDDLDKVHSGLAPILLTLRIGQSVRAALVELRAARLLLDRLMSRRYFRPVFRALPSTKDTTLQAGPDALANLFRQPDLRYSAEREIEIKAHLPAGTITIHCPTRTTARKIANVFLTKPDTAGDDPVCKLKDIASLDKEIFGEHERAVKAVEHMYGSMWRLTVYVAPEHFERWEEIRDAAGRVIFEAVDVHHHFTDRPDRKWRNDPSLDRELQGKMYGSLGDVGGEVDRTPFGETLGQIGDELLGSKRLRDIPQSLRGPTGGLSAEGRKRVEDALVIALNGTESKRTQEPERDRSMPRQDQVFTIIRGYVKRIGKDDVSSFQRAYGGRLNGLSSEAFEMVASGLESAVAKSKQLDESSPEHKGYKFKECMELLEQLVEQYTNHRVTGGGHGLFEGQNE